jgi:hypothetical protein
MIAATLRSHSRDECEQQTTLNDGFEMRTSGDDLQENGTNAKEIYVVEREISVQDERRMASTVKGGGGGDEMKDDLVIVPKILS